MGELCLFPFSFYFFQNIGSYKIKSYKQDIVNHTAHEIIN